MRIGVPFTVPITRSFLKRETFAPLARTSTRFGPGGTATSIDSDAASAAPTTCAGAGLAQKKFGMARATMPDQGQSRSSAMTATRAYDAKSGAATATAAAIQSGACPARAKWAAARGRAIATI